MRAVIQRVSKAEVIVDGIVNGRIGKGILMLLGIGKNDTEEDARYILKKTLELRIFPDKNSIMNKSLIEVGGHLLVVSQFTLYGDCRKGRRPSYSHAMSGENARKLYEFFLKIAEESPVFVQSGVFQAMMRVHLINDGPVTLLLDSKKQF